MQGTMVIVLAMLCLPGPVLAACRDRAPPSIPDGARATLEQMRIAADEMRIYMGEMNDYLACLDFERERGRDNTALYNETVERIKGIADAFNVQAQLFRDRAPADGMPRPD